MKLDFSACYRALCARDDRFDGLFFVGVNTTGIYCRPVCRARTPRETSCVFVDTAAAAEKAGFRPCLRCRPELAPAQGIVAGAPIEHALFTHVQAHALGGGNMTQVAVRSGYSGRQLRRLLVRSHGVTPIQIVQTQRLLFARKLLRETQLPVIDVALGAGFGSLRRFNASFRERYGIAPSAARGTQRWRTPAAPGAAGDELTLGIAYREPLAWVPMLGYLRRRSIPGVESVDIAAGTYARTLEIGGKTGRMEVRLDREARCIQVRVPVELSSVLFAILERVRRLFDLDMNPEPVRAHLGADCRLAPLVAAVPGLRVPGAWDVFELAVRAVLGQQISVAGATTLAGRLAGRFGHSLGGCAPNLISPAPERLAEATVEDIAAIGLPMARARAIRALAEAARSGALEFAPGTPPESAIGTLRRIPGIGEWTAQYIAMRALRFPDCFPSGDLGLQKAASMIEGKPVGSAELLRMAEAWRPWRAYAALYLWQSLS